MRCYDGNVLFHNAITIVGGMRTLSKAAMMPQQLRHAEDKHAPVF